MSYKNANACHDKVREAQRLDIPILTFWSGTDEGKCEVDSRGKDVANVLLKIPDTITARGEDPTELSNLAAEINAHHSDFPNKREYGRCNGRSAFVIDTSKLVDMRKELHTTETLVIHLF